MKSAAQLHPFELLGSVMEVTHHMTLLAQMRSIGESGGRS